MDLDRKSACEHFIEPSDGKIQIFGEEERGETSSEIVHPWEGNEVHRDFVQIDIE